VISGCLPLRGLRNGLTRRIEVRVTALAWQTGAGRIDDR
jgi:hypothetical protein